MSKSKLIIINGFPASGKSTLTARISKELSIPAFAKDDFKELLANTIGYTDHESTRPFGKASFASLFLVGRRCLESGVPVIIEGNFTLGQETLDFLEYLKQSEIDVREVLCYADGQLLIDRFYARTLLPERHPVHHTLGEDELKKYADKVLSLGKDTPLTKGKVLEVDTTNPERINYEDIIEFLS